MSKKPLRVEDEDGEPKSELQKHNNEVAKEVQPEGVEVLSEFTKELNVSLNTEELLQRGQRIAQLSADMGAFEQREEAVKAQLKADKARIEADQNVVIIALRNKSEPRQVPCHRLRDFGRGIIYEVRLDTNETISERPLTHEERQTALDLRQSKKDDLFDQAKIIAEQTKNLGKEPDGDEAKTE